MPFFCRPSDGIGRGGVFAGVFFSFMYCSSGGILRSCSGKYTPLVGDHKEITAGVPKAKRQRCLPPACSPYIFTVRIYSASKTLS
ncbi:hypothetical protein H206_06123 [Candidatus Electrothrix aarhusensis]|uniref:Uncharacterized protein n=1 Tax=Candidatus Electrothrix aarhusensis TaxID=1859131 RepID=A0A444J3F2_9BACT|nr:hypothetical protein H206_06123 [Candidatus Electrothrix aarhusensis]